MSEARVSLKGIEKLQRDMPKLRNTLEARIAKRAPSEIVSNAYAGKTGIFPANSLPFNKPSTIARKGHGIRLDDTGDLLSIQDWRIERTKEGHKIKPPANREAVVGYLNSPTENRPAYKIMDLPLGFFPLWAAKIVQAFFRKNIKNYT
jgi:hypothetical protein